MMGLLSVRTVAKQMSFRVRVPKSIFNSVVVAMPEGSCVTASGVCTLECFSAVRYSFISGTCWVHDLN